MYKQTISGVFTPIQDGILFTFLLLVISYFSPSIIPFTLELTLLLAVEFILFASMYLVVFATGVSILSSRATPITISTVVPDGKINEFTEAVSGFTYTRIQLIGGILSEIFRSGMLAIVLTYAYFLGGVYLLGIGIIILFIAPSVFIYTSDNIFKGSYNWDSYESTHSELDQLLSRLSEYYDIHPPRVFTADSDFDEFYIIKSVWVQNTLVLPQSLIEKEEFDTTDIFKLAHEFGHLYIDSTYKFKSILGSSLVFAGYLALVALGLVPTSFVLLFMASLFTVVVSKLLSTYYRRVEEYRVDTLASEFTGLSDSEKIMTMVKLTGSSENPFTYPADSILGKIHTAMEIHPPLRSRINHLLDDR